MFAFIGPMIGAALYDEVGFRYTFDVVMFIMWGIALIYLVFVAGFKAFSDYDK
jgi:hypothetical protein